VENSISDDERAANETCGAKNNAWVRRLFFLQERGVADRLNAF
jgi:hypothetical protein